VAKAARFAVRGAARWSACRVGLGRGAGVVDAPNCDIRLGERGNGPGKNSGGFVVVFRNRLHRFSVKRRGDAGVNFIDHIELHFRLISYGRSYA